VDFGHFLCKGTQMSDKTSNELSARPKSNYSNLIEAIGGLIESARSRVVQTINTEMVRLYWEIGRHIVEYEQEGNDRIQCFLRELL